jgi:thiol-disulfide isomerase/thioredoxin
MTTPSAPIPRAARATVLGLLALASPIQAPARAQAAAPAPAPAREADAALRAIDDAYNRKLHEIELERLDGLRRVAAERRPKEAAPVYEQLFRLAIANNLFVDAEPAADAVIKAGASSPTVGALARLVKLVAECDRGAYDQSLTDLGAILTKVDETAGGKLAPAIDLTTEELIGISDAYYQRLVQAGRFDVARKAFELAAGRAENPAVKSFLDGRLARLKRIGEPAAPIQGVDLDGKPFNLSDLKGKVVLVVFWTTWCLPSAAETEWLHQAYEAYHPKGFEIVGVNLDLMQDDAPKLETLMPNIRRFVLDYNVRWPTLVNGPADGDVAKAYAVTEVPANVLIDRDGKVAAIDLSRKNLESTVSKLVGP